jgi:hypothetical protein
MKISELIEELKNAKLIHGDIKVNVWDYHGEGWGEVEKVSYNMKSIFLKTD